MKSTDLVHRYCPREPLFLKPDLSTQANAGDALFPWGARPSAVANPRFGHSPACGQFRRINQLRTALRANSACSGHQLDICRFCRHIFTSVQRLRKPWFTACAPWMAETALWRKLELFQRRDDRAGVVHKKGPGLAEPLFETKFRCCLVAARCRLAEARGLRSPRKV